MVHTDFYLDSNDVSWLAVAFHGQAVRFWAMERGRSVRTPGALCTYHTLVSSLAQLSEVRMGLSSCQRC